MNGPLCANEFLKISIQAYGNVTKLVDVEFLISHIATSLQIVMQSEIYYVGAMPRIHLNTVMTRSLHNVIIVCSLRDVFNVHSPRYTGWCDEVDVVFSHFLVSASPWYVYRVS